MTRSPARRPAAILLIGVALLLAWLNFQSLTEGVIGLFHDDGIYVSNALSLARGDGYRLINLPTSPAQTKYPPLYSVLLAPVWLLSPGFPHNVLLFKAINVGIYFSLVVFTYWYARSRVASESRLVPVGVAALVATSRGIFSYTDFALSDLLFAMLVTLALLLWRGDDPGRMSIPRLLACAVVIGLASLTRALGVALAIAAMAQCLRYRQVRPALIVAAVVAVVLGPWLVWSRVHSQPADNPLIGYYTQYEQSALAYLPTQPGRTVEIVRSNAVYALRSVPIVFGPAWGVLWPVPLMMIGLGVWRSRRSLVSFGAIFGMTYGMIVLAHPFAPHRYLLPLIPAACLLAVEGARAVGAMAQRLIREAVVPWPSVMTSVFCGLLVAGNLIWLNKYLRSEGAERVRGWYGLDLGYGWQGFAETFDWIREHTAPNDRLGTAYDPMYFLYTGRRGVRPWLHNPESYFYPLAHRNPHVGAPAEVLDHLRRLGVRYLIVDPLDGYAEKEVGTRLMVEVAALAGAASRPVFRSADGKHVVYELR